MSRWGIVRPAAGRSAVRMSRWGIVRPAAGRSAMRMCRWGIVRPAAGRSAMRMCRWGIVRPVAGGSAVRTCRWGIVRPVAARRPTIACRTRRYFRDAADLTWSPTAAVVVEVDSPDDETWANLAFYHRVGVEEMIIADPEARSVTVLARARDAFEPVQRSAILGIGAAQLRDAIDWPA